MPSTDRTEAAAGKVIEPVDRRTSSLWADKVFALTKRQITNGVELAAARRELFQALLDEAMRITRPKCGSVRLYDRKYHQSAFFLTAGEGWTDAIRKRVYKDEGPSAFARVVQTRDLLVIPDVKHATYFCPLWEDVQAHVSVPLFLNQEDVAVLSLDARDVNAR